MYNLMDALRRSVEAERSGSERSKSERPAAAHRRDGEESRSVISTRAFVVNVSPTEPSW
jgi:hypothetical protein